MDCAARCPAWERSSASPRAPRSARWACSASSPMARARRSGRCWPSASRSRAALFWAAGRGRGGAAAAPPGRRSGWALGACGYALQAGCYFAALAAHRRVAAVAAHLHVPGAWRRAAIALGRERVDSAPGGALIVASGGLALLVAGAARARSTRSGRARPDRGASPTARTSSSARESPSACAPQVLAALVCTGAAVALTVGSAVLGDLRLGRADSRPAGAGWPRWRPISTVGAIGLFFAGLARVGPTTRRSSPPPSRW